MLHFPASYKVFAEKNRYNLRKSCGDYTCFSPQSQMALLHVRQAYILLSMSGIKQLRSSPLRLPALLLALVILAGACTRSAAPGSAVSAINQNDQIVQTDRIDQFEPETLGLTPGATAVDVNLNWYANAGGGDTALARFIDEKGNVVTAVGTVSPASKGKAVCKVSVTGLTPDTWYRYYVSNDGKNWSGEYNFKTAKTNYFRFAVTGDPQLTRWTQDRASNLFSADKTTAQGWKDTLAKIAAANVAFIAGVGDQVNAIPKGNEAEYRKFFAPAELKAIPFSPAAGNHDRHYLFLYHFNLPNEQKFDPIINAKNKNNAETRTAETAANYWYLYNNALFVVLNTSAYPDSAAAAMPYIERFDKTFNAAINANKGKFTWLFVQHHKSTASVAEHIADRDIQYYVEAGFEKLMDKYTVDFVLSGHDHVYARTFAMRDGKPVNKDRDKIINPGGVIYLTVNTSSGLKYGNIFDSKEIYVKNNKAYPYLADGTTGSANYLRGVWPLSTNVAYQNKKPEYTIIEVTDKTVTFNTYDIDSDKPIDTFTVTK